MERTRGTAEALRLENFASQFASVAMSPPAALQSCSTTVLATESTLAAPQYENGKAAAAPPMAESAACPPGPLQDYLAEEGKLRNQGTLRYACVHYKCT